MSNCRWFWLVGLALVVAARPALAQRVVVLEFEGDKQEKLRTQVEAALKKAEVVELVPLAKYKEAAAKKKLKGASAMTPAAVGKLARSLALDAAVEGALGDTFFVRILDSSGQELWSKDLPIKAGLISPDHAKKLAKAVAAAAKTSAGPRPEPEDKGPGGAEVAVEADAPVVKPERKTDETPSNSMPEIDLTAAAPTGPSGPIQTGRRDDSSSASSSSEPDRDTDLDNNSRKAKFKTGPQLVTATVSGTTVWRAYCSRPGVKSCREYDAKEPVLRPKGDTVDFSPQVPYAGFLATLDVFPLFFLDNPANGIGLVGAYGRGWSLTNVRVQTPSGETPEKQVISVDDAYAVAGVYRYFFAYQDMSETDKNRKVVGYVGLRGGVAGRIFEVDPTANVPLPGSHRSYPVLGLDLAVPLIKYLRFEASGSYFLNPKAGPDEIAGYGDPTAFEGGATGSGFGFDVGIAGTLYGPLGYTLKFRYVSYADQFFGQGQKWPCDESQCGGAAEETYSGITWGLSAAF